MKLITYKLHGIITFIIGAIFFFNWISLLDSGSDGLWVLFFGSLILFVLGIFYFLFGLSKFKVNKLSDVSLKTIIFGFIVAFGGTLLILIYSFLTNADPMGILLSLIFIYLGIFISFVAFVFLILALVKKHNSK